MVRNLMGCVTAGLACFGVMTAADAAIYDFGGKLVDVEYWAGAGSNEALLVLDFGPSSGGSHDSFVFGYRWNDGDLFNRPEDSSGDATISAATSEAMLMTIVQQGGLDVGYWYHSALGLSLSSFSYAGHSFDSDWVNNFAALWHSGNLPYTDWEGEEYPMTAPDGESWIRAGVGVSSRELLNGFYDGWTKGTVTVDEYLADPPVINVVPEPASLMILAAGVLAMLRQRA